MILVMTCVITDQSTFTKIIKTIFKISTCLDIVETTRVFFFYRTPYLIASDSSTSLHNIWNAASPLIGNVYFCSNRFTTQYNIG